MRLPVVYLLLLLTHFTIVCTGCPKHAHLRKTGERKDDQNEHPQRQESDEKETDNSNAEVVEEVKVGNSKQLLSTIPPEQSTSVSTFKSSAEHFVESAMDHLTVQSLMPLLTDAEYHSREALRQATTQSCEKEHQDGYLGGIVKSLLHLISALKAVRADLHEASVAWGQLKDAVHGLAAHHSEGAVPEGTIAHALATFLEAQMWMKAKVKIVKYSTGVLQRIANEMEVKKAMSIVEHGAQALARLAEHLNLRRNENEEV